MTRVFSPPAGFIAPKDVKIKEIAERHLLYDLNEAMVMAEEKFVKAVLSGGMAVRAYVGAVRYTSDVDLIVPKEGAGAMRRILKDLGYRGKQQDFGPGKILFAKKTISDKKHGLNYNLEFDVSIGGLFDASSGHMLEWNKSTYEDSKRLPLWGYFESSRSLVITARVLSLEDLFVMKTMTKSVENNGREKDTLDALLLALKNPPDYARVWRICGHYGITRHIADQITQKLMRRLEDNNADIYSSNGMHSFSENERIRINGVLSGLLANVELTGL